MTRLDAAMLEKYKLNKVILKFAKRGDEYIKELANQVLDPGGKPGKPIIADTKDVERVEKKVAVPVKANSSIVRAAAPSTKTAVPLSKPIDRKPTTQSAVKSSTGVANRTLPITSKAMNDAKVDGKAGGTGTPTTLPTKEKIKHVISKPSVFASLQSASKKPGTSNAAQKAGQNVTQAR